MVVTIYLFSRGVSYYDTSLEERFYHPDHALLKPSGIMGHGLGIIGTLLILIGVFGYIARKRYGFLARFGRLKYWLEFHIFLCTLGPIMILFHTAFKFGGIVSVSFWSMVAVVASGVIGRFIYIQIPRTIEGRELSLAEVKGMKINIESILKNSYTLDETSYTAILESTQLPSRTGEGGLLSRVINKYFDDQRTVSRLKQNLRENRLPEPDIRKVARLIRNELSLNNRIERLQSMQNLFKYWHVAHLPFALIMLVFLVIHVAVVLTFGFKWIF
ncbi:MAG TPA: hypothetical protein PKE06_24195 [Flavilitoribacter sp.]|nr:hypothetical protein [Flavilitoribacter sp.]HMQ87941.1 hypothetical protein [Flavilitoribacter sp.]